MCLWFGHQGFPLHYFLNSTNLDHGIGQKGNSLIKFICPQGKICQPSFSNHYCLHFMQAGLHEIINDTIETVIILLCDQSKLEDAKL